MTDDPKPAGRPAPPPRPAARPGPPPKPTGQAGAPPLPGVGATRAAERPIEGTLGDTPLSNLLLQILGQSLSGTLEVRVGGSVGVGESESEVRRLYFVDGAPARTAPTAGVPAAAAITATLDVADALDEHVADAAARVQVLACVKTLAAIGGEASYVFRHGVDAVEGADLPARPRACDPLEAFMVAVRSHREPERLDDALLRLAGRPLVLHPRADVARLGPDVGERAVLDAIAAGGATYADLVAAAPTHPEVPRRTVYALMFTRQLQLEGVRADPLGSTSGARPAVARRADAIVDVARRGPEASHYDVLGVARDAAAAEIASAHAALATALDPGTLPAELEILRKPATRAFARVNRVVQVLGDPARRGAYDATVASAALTDDAHFERVLGAAELARSAEKSALEGRLEEAQRTASQAIEQDPNHAEYAQLLAWIRALRGAPDARMEAMQTLDRALAQPPRSDRHFVMRALLHRADEHDDDATEDLRRALEINPGNADARRLLTGRTGPALARAATRPAPDSERKTERKGASTKGTQSSGGGRIALIVVGVLALIVVGLVLLGRRRTPAERTREALAGWAIDNEVHPNAGTLPEEAEIEAEPDAARTIVEALGDSTHVVDAHGNHSEIPLQRAANAYLCHRAEVRRQPPPPTALAVREDVAHGVGIVPARWETVQKEWAEWFAAPPIPGAMPESSDEPPP